MRRSGLSIMRLFLCIICILFSNLSIRHVIDFRTASIGIFGTVILWALLIYLQILLGQKSTEEAARYVNTLLVVMTVDGYVASLVTASATTGWLDWIHGEIWVFPHGLLRIPSDLGKTMMNGAGPTVDRYQLKVQLFTHEQFRQLVAKKSNRWIPREQIAQAYLHRGILSDCLRLMLVDSRSEKLLYLSIDNAFPVLQKVFRDWLNNELVIN